MNRTNTGQEKSDKAKTKRARNKYYSGPVTDHFDGVNFYNPGGHPPAKLADLLKWQILEKGKKWPSRSPSPYQDEPPARVNGNKIRAGFVGHATVLIQTGGLNILTDPVWSERCSPTRWAGPKRVNAPGIGFDKLPQIDVVLLSHNHYDHLDLKTLSALRQRDNPRIITPLGNDRILFNHDPAFDISVGDWGDTIVLSQTTKVSFEPAHHWSARGTRDRRNALWAAFVVEGPAGKIYHVGDTGFHDGINYRAAKEKYGGFRLAILPFGAYEPRWFMKYQHQNPDEAVQGHILCGADYTLGHHWGTFQLTNESIEDQLNDLAIAREKHGLAADEFRALQPGQSWEIPDRRPGRGADKDNRSDKGKK